MEKKQSSIDWLIEESNKQKAWADPSKLEPIIQQAKAMHQDEIIDSILDNRNITSQVTFKDAEQYYNEKFGGEQ